MDCKYADNAKIFKVLSDPTRLMIIDMLSYGELCACIILAKFQITQPTLSYHMKALCDSGLVNGRKQGKWMYYSLNNDVFENVRDFLDDITTSSISLECIESSCEVVCK